MQLGPTECYVCTVLSLKSIEHIQGNWFSLTWFILRLFPPYICICSCICTCICIEHIQGYWFSLTWFILRLFPPDADICWFLLRFLRDFWWSFANYKDAVRWLIIVISSTMIQDNDENSISIEIDDMDEDVYSLSIDNHDIFNNDNYNWNWYLVWILMFTGCPLIIKISSTMIWSIFDNWCYWNWHLVWMIFVHW